MVGCERGATACSPQAAEAVAPFTLEPTPRPPSLCKVLRCPRGCSLPAWSLCLC